MGTTGQETHRPGALKQTNKTHKTGRHRSKGSINALAKGTLQIFIKHVNVTIQTNLNKIQRVCVHRYDKYLQFFYFLFPSLFFDITKQL